MEENVNIDGPLGPINVYNPRVAAQRAGRLADSTIAVFNMYADLSPGRQRPPLTMGLLGDFLTGAIHEENHRTTALPPTEAADYAYELLRKSLDHTVRWAKPSRVQIVERVGNHGRITRKNHAIAKRGYNLELGIYQRLREHFGDMIWGVPVEWCEPPAEGGIGYAPLSFGRVGRYMHGEEVHYNGGVGGLYTPLATRVNRWNTEPGAAGALSFFGHWHTYTSAELALGNGSLIGHSALGRGYAAPYEPPCQAMGVISEHATRGFQATHRLMVEG